MTPQTHMHACTFQVRESNANVNGVWVDATVDLLYRVKSYSRRHLIYMKTSPASLPTHATMPQCVPHEQILHDYMLHERLEHARSFHLSVQQATTAGTRPRAPRLCWLNCTPFTTKSFVLAPSDPDAL